MKYIYILSIISLIVFFLLLKKNNEKENIITWIVYSGCLLMCFNIFIVFINYYLKIGSSLFNLSLINYLLSIIFIILIKNKGYQKYFFIKRELISLVLIIFISFLVGFIRFNGLQTISYESGDSSIHYQMAEHFSNNMNLLDEDNSVDIVYGNFKMAMPGYYINAGLLIKIFDILPSYKAYILFDILFLVVSSCLFLVTVLSIQKKNILLSIIVSILYFLGYPLNNLIFGFGYLGLGIMFINLLYLTILLFKDNYKDNNIMKIIIITLINFSIFYSYYLFVPIIYLSLGLYYIYNYKKKNINFKDLLLYGIITLIIPFIIGCIYFILPSFIDSNTGTIIGAIKEKGYVYNNSFTILLLTIPLSFISAFKSNKNITYEKFNFFSAFGMIVLFLILITLKKAQFYYYLKLFYLLWFIIFIIYIKIFDLEKIKKYIYIMIIVMVISLISLNLFNKNSSINKIFINSLTYTYNFSRYSEDYYLFDKDELELVNKGIDYHDICVVNNEFLISGNKLKNLWYYSITNTIPLINYYPSNSRSLQNANISYKLWKDLSNKKCLVYFYEEDEINDYSNMEVLYKNEKGVIIKKLTKN